MSKTIDPEISQYFGSNVPDPRFQPLVDVFRSNFDKGLEPAGASFAVYKDGKLVADIFGGKADVEKSQCWTEHSMSVLFSTTKSISATILAYVMDAHNISYEEKVSKFWPEFAANGKENTTILQVTLHQAGVPYSHTMVTREDVKDWRRMSKYFEDATPVWQPGTANGYHALTIGLLFDQIVRRIDSKQRGIEEIFENDFIRKYGHNGWYKTRPIVEKERCTETSSIRKLTGKYKYIKDLGIGISTPCVNHRVARLKNPTDEEVLEQGARQPEALRRYMAGDNDHNKRLYETWPWITTDDYNLLENRLLPMPSNMGIGNARGLAHFHSLLATKTILHPEFYETNLSAPVLENEFDVIIGYPESKGYGWQFTRNPKGDYIFGHSGFGGQNVRVDTHYGVSYAYVSNGMKIADADMVEPWNNLVNKLYTLL